MTRFHQALLTSVFKEQCLLMFFPSCIQLLTAQFKTIVSSLVYKIMMFPCISVSFWYRPLPLLSFLTGPLPLLPLISCPPHTVYTHVSVEGDSGNLVEPTSSCLFLLKMFLLLLFCFVFYESHCIPGYPGIHYLGKLTSDL